MERYETFDDLLFSSDDRTRAIAEVLHDAPSTVSEICNLTGYTDDKVRITLDRFRRNKLAHISQWARVNAYGVAALYKAGPGIDAERPRAADPNETIREDRTAKALVSNLLHYQELSAAIVPRRTEQEQYEVNQRYLNWLSSQTGPSAL